MSNQPSRITKTTKIDSSLSSPTTISTIKQNTTFFSSKPKLFKYDSSFDSFDDSLEAHQEIIMIDSGKIRKGIIRDYEDVDSNYSVPHFKYIRPNIIIGSCENHVDSKEYIEASQMKMTLAKLSNDFHSGKLHAFGEYITFESMLKIREQQENLARLHFELNLQQSSKQQVNELDFFEDNPSNSIMTKLFSKSNMQKLIQNLQNLCKSIERLQLQNSKESSKRY